MGKSISAGEFVAIVETIEEKIGIQYSNEIFNVLWGMCKDMDKPKINKVLKNLKISSFRLPTVRDWAIAVESVLE